ncbi:MAG: hypothetical protein K6T78_16095 [Alicyclobacillus sp.]|nr:hypothetical protein [Alicyclobacillus sp.]
MRIHQVSFNLTADDLTSLIQDFAPDAKFRIAEITPSGIHGHIRLLLWSVDFLARPRSSADGVVSLEISASKLVPIPPALVQRQLKEALRDAPNGIDVIHEALTVHLPSVLAPFDLHLTVRELRCGDGILHLTLEDIDLPRFQQLSALLRKEGPSR